VVHQVSSRPAPMDLAVARERIRRTLAGERARGVVAAELARVRAGARIEYRDEFIQTRQAGTRQGSAAPGNAMLVTGAGAAAPRATVANTNTQGARSAP